ncbi:MAG: formyltransferase family protein [Beijerinckiaceae bacterium]
MKICLLTYDAPHRKTYQVANGLNKRGFATVDFLLMPFVQRNAREVMFNHRPPQFNGGEPREVAKRLGATLHDYANWETLVEKYDYFIVCGSNLIEEKFANSGKVINVHAGLIPHVRGLDSFKWAIHDLKPLGNTIHIIDSNADMGEVIAHEVTDVFHGDDLPSLASRHYENEIYMLTHFDQYLESRIKNEYAMSSATKRMPIETERVMFERFSQYKNKYAISA